MYRFIKNPPLLTFLLHGEISDKYRPYISFMALPVIPSLRITDMGMFDVERFQFIERAE